MNFSLIFFFIKLIAEYCPCPSRNSPLFNSIKKELTKKGENDVIERKKVGDRQILRTQVPSSSQQYKRRFHKQ